MISIGQFNTLNIVKRTRHSFILDGGRWGEISMNIKEAQINDIHEGHIDAFVYFDSDNHLIATTKEPYASVNQFAFLQVVDEGPAGFFLDWGLPKDLLLPHKEKTHAVQVGKYILVYVYLDPQTYRIVASAKAQEFLDQTPANYQAGEAVDLMIMQSTDLGWKAIIHDQHTGVLYHNELFRPIKVGDFVKGFIKKVREDGKIDLTLEPAGNEKHDLLSQTILEKLQKSNGTLPFGDHTPPEIIAQTFHVSKGQFKRAIGYLFKKRLIEIFPEKITLTK